MKIEKIKDHMKNFISRIREGTRELREARAIGGIVVCERSASRNLAREYLDTRIAS